MKPGSIRCINHLPRRIVTCPESSGSRPSFTALDTQTPTFDQRAPYPGRILDIFAIAGQSMAPGTPLMTLGRIDWRDRISGSKIYPLQP